MPQKIIASLTAGKHANLSDKFRRGSLVELPAQGRLIISGDIHGHRRNFEKLVKYADLAANPDRHLILQEIIHGGPQDDAGGCKSYEVLAEAAELKGQFPHQLHFVLGNHDTAFIANTEVMKNGKEMNSALNMALAKRYENHAADVASAIEQFVFSQPLAVKCQNRIWISHSLPADRFLEQFDFTIFGRPLKVYDIVRPNSAYLLTWGRGHSQQTLKTMAEKLDVDLFVLGHQMQESGWIQAGDNTIIIISEHNHGCFVEIDLAAKYTIDALIKAVRPIAGLE